MILMVEEHVENCNTLTRVMQDLAERNLSGIQIV